MNMLKLRNQSGLGYIKNELSHFAILYQHLQVEVWSTCKFDLH